MMTMAYDRYSQGEFADMRSALAKTAPVFLAPFVLLTIVSVCLAECTRRRQVRLRGRRGGVGFVCPTVGADGTGGLSTPPPLARAAELPAVRRSGSAESAGMPGLRGRLCSAGA